MKYNLFIIFLCFFLLSFFGDSKGQVAKSPKPDIATKSDIWNKISPYFSPSPKYEGRFGDYRSPLKFYNGDSVLTKEDWNLRRIEILNRWNDLMGEWPPFIIEQNFIVLDSIRQDNFMRYHVKFKWLPNQYTTGYLLVPIGIVHKMPAVITTFYEPETAVGEGKPYRDFAYQLAKRGFITLSLGTTETTNAKTYSLYYPGIDSATIQPLSTLAYAAANAWYALSKVPQVDSNRIGIMGHSYGGKWAMFASCLFDKFAAAVWSDPGIVFDETKGSLINYWEPWYLGYYPPPWKNAWRKKGMVENAQGLYPELVKEGYNLQELHALMDPRPFLVSGGESDQESRWEVLNYSVQVNHLLGYTNRVAMTNRSHHSPTEESNEQAYLFLEYFLKNSATKDAEEIIK